MTYKKFAHGQRMERVPRERIQPYLTRPLARRLASYCASIGATESAVAESAIAQYLDRTSDHTTLMRRLDRLSRTSIRAERNLDVLAEALATFIQVWFAHAPTVPNDAKDHARRESARRYQQFVDHVATRLGRGRHFIEELAKDLADVDELQSTRKAAEEQGTTPMGLHDCGP